MTLTDFLLARIAEDEAWARASVKTPGATHWHWVNSETDKPVTPDPFTQETITDDSAVSLRSVEELKPVSWGDGQPLPDFVIWRIDDVLSPGAAGHIARHDPARVLAECEAKRRIVELHSPYDTKWPEDEWECSCCGDVPQVPYPCLDLKILAAIYADHPDYRQEWKP